MEQIHAFLSTLQVGASAGTPDLTVFPLISPSSIPPAYDTLRDAIAAGHTRVTEVSESGSVPELRVVNHGSRPVLIVDGEELVGAKQNRIVNITILVPADTTLTIPVSCVERGRWSQQSKEFAPAERAFYAAGRRANMVQVSLSMSESLADWEDRDARHEDTGPHGSGEPQGARQPDARRSHTARRADQGAVWADIADKSSRMGGIVFHRGGRRDIRAEAAGTGRARTGFAARRWPGRRDLRHPRRGRGARRLRRTRNVARPDADARPQLRP